MGEGTHEGDAPTREVSPWDPVSLDLQRLRAAAGAPSFAEVARRIERRRADRGLPPGECRVARTTVYDAFRLGRTRMDAALVCEIVEVLGGSVESVRAALREASLRRPDPAPAVPGAPTHPVEPLDPAGIGTPPPSLDPAGGDSPARAWRWRAVVAVMTACLAANLLGRVLVDSMQVPLYLDMVGTAVAAVLLGPWRGVVVAVATNVVGVATSGPESLPFVLINVAGALVWGYGVWRLGAARSVSRFFGLCVVVALTCSALAVPIIVVMGGATGNGADAVVQVVLARTGHLWLAVTASNVVTSLGDKLISGFLALLVLDAVASRSTPSGRMSGSSHHLG